MSLEPFLDFKKHFPGIFCLWNFEAVNIQFWDKARHHTILIDSYTLLTTFTLLQTIIISTPMSKNLERLENNESFWRYLAIFGDIWRWRILEKVGCNSPNIAKNHHTFLWSQMVPNIMKHITNYILSIWKFSPNYIFLT